MRCSRCHGHFYLRHPRSLQYTLAWTISALIMFVPANLFPIMIYYELGVAEPMTILEGINSLIESDMFPIAFIVFTASFFCAFGKALWFNLFSTGNLSKADFFSGILWQDL